MILLSGGAGCEIERAPQDAAAATPQPSAEPADSAPAATSPAPAPAPAAAVAPPPPGAVDFAGGHAQRCDEAHPCPALLQAEGAAHCAALVLGETRDWRLPERDEVKAFAGLELLEARGGYHWTATPDPVDPAMFWIVDPDGAQPTTLPPTRKPFRIRCVRP